MKKIIFTSAILVLLASCIGWKEYVEKRLRSFVMEYYRVDGMTLRGTFGRLDFFQGKAVIGVILESKGSVGRYDAEEGTAQKIVYDELCEKHGDMTYNRKVLVGGGMYVRYPEVDFTAIEVTSDADYDAGHPAGSSLKDIMTFRFDTAKPFIESGYKEYDESIGDMWKYSIITKALEDVTAGDLVLLGYGRGKRIGNLIFDQMPTLDKTHVFTVTLTPDDGREPLTASVELIFE